MIMAINSWRVCWYSKKLRHTIHVIWIITHSSGADLETRHRFGFGSNTICCPLSDTHTFGSFINSVRQPTTAPTIICRLLTLPADSALVESGPVSLLGDYHPSLPLFHIQLVVKVVSLQVRAYTGRQAARVWFWLCYMAPHSIDTAAVLTTPTLLFGQA